VKKRVRLKMELPRIEQKVPYREVCGTIVLLRAQEGLIQQRVRICLATIGKIMAERMQFSLSFAVLAIVPSWTEEWRWPGKLLATIRYVTQKKRSNPIPDSALETKWDRREGQETNRQFQTLSGNRRLPLKHLLRPVDFDYYTNEAKSHVRISTG
jgi:hypothetical protein